MVAQLLNHYRHQQKEVAIVFWGVPPEQNCSGVKHSFKEMFTSLMDSLNSMTKLRNLKVDFCTARGSPVVLDDYQLVQHSLHKVVGRLETLNFRISIEFSSSDNRLAKACLLKQVLFGMRDGRGGGADKSAASSSKQENLALYFPVTPLTLRTLISLGPGPVAAGLRLVEIDGAFSGNSKAEYKALARFARQSPHLQSLTIKVNSFSIWRLVESLSSLKELVTLDIRCRISYLPHEEVNVSRLPVLSTVKSLGLSSFTLSHRDYEQLHLETLFPNLQVVDWNSWGCGCTDCGYENPEETIAHLQPDQINLKQFKADYGRQMNECLRLARLSAFSRLPQFTRLLMKVRLGFPKFPFKHHVFTSLQSLGQRTEFIEMKGEESDQEYVLYR